MRWRARPALAISVALLVLGGGIAWLLWRFAPFASSPDRPPGEKAATAVPAPSRADPPAPPPPFTPPGAVAWPELEGDAARRLAEGRRLLARAGAAYARAESAGRGDLRAQADTAMLAALERLRQAGIDRPELRAWYEETVRSAAERQDLPEVRRRLLLWLRHFPRDLYARERLIVAGMRSGDLPAALRAAESVLEDRPRSAIAIEARALTLHRLGKRAKAVEAARAWTELEPQVVKAWRLLAAASYELGDQASGEEATRRMLELIGFPSPACWDHPEGRVTLEVAIKVLHRFRLYDALLPVAREYRSRYPKAAWAAAAEGSARLHTGDPSGAEAAFLIGLGDEDNREEVRFELALARAKQGRLARAARDFAELLLDHPNHQRASYQLGLAYRRLGRRREARALLERSRELAASDREIEREREYRVAGLAARAAESRSRGLRMRGEFRAAFEALEAPELAGDPRNLIHRIELYCDTLRVLDAAPLQERLEERIGVGHPDAEGCRSRILWTRGKREEALARLERITTRPGGVEYWKLERARRLLEAGRIAPAASVAAELHQGQSDLEAAWLLARARLRQGRGGEALQLLETIPREDKRWSAWDLGVWRAWARAAAGEPAAAWEELSSLEPRERATRAGVRAALEITRRVPAESGVVSPDQRRHAEEIASEAEALHPRIIRLKQQLARTAWARSAALRLQLADLCEASGDRRQAVREAGLALAADPDADGARERLARWLDREEEAFLRLHHLRELVRLRPGDAEAGRKWRELRSRWVPQPSPATGEREAE